MALLEQLPRDLVSALGVSGARSLSGGDSANAFRLETGNGPVFAKTMPHPAPGVLPLEAAALEKLRAVAPEEVRVPAVCFVSEEALALEWIEEAHGAPDRATERSFGTGLAAVHAAPAPHVGWLGPELPERIGSVPVDLTPTDDWADFLLERRIEPLLRQAVDAGNLDPAASALLEALAPRAAELAGPPEPPSLLHGDLWAGNRVVDASGGNWLIDPSSFYGHREYDLAMMQLFGGFGRECFAAYGDAHPLADGWQERVPWYQLPPLLIHAIRFGGGYGASVMSALRRLG
ncbi:fructosamine kinase family protein [Kocuria rhizophila]|uniref:fructosamine kinase family protein n=1 Tax=Kocuria rhizophila TaxID=72000 RepID=UPI001EF51C0D|nr:fructosamine kinase family protein [Kocuria rhizophila]MCG7423780.1 fructosamine kinase family protein [Kocuria rhizophila]MCT1879607.1 fructosamine kinase family protein [Kocuria rhizophila]